MRKSNFQKMISGVLVASMVALCTMVTGVDSYAYNTVDMTSIGQSSSSAIVVGTDVKYTATFASRPSSDDGKLYLFELKTYEYGIPDGRSYILSTEASTNVNVSFPLEYTGGYGRLYNKFVLAAKRGGTWVLVNNAQYITNPEAVATAPKARAPREVKMLQRGNVANISLTGSGIPTGIGAQHAVFTNTDPNVVTADPHRGGDSHPVRNNPVVAYMLNADSDAGCEGLIADMIAYTDGLTNLQDFVIGNEVNERCWNYMAYVDWDTYVRKYVQAFRICYTAIKSHNPNAMVYTSLDQVWNKNTPNTEYLDGDEFLEKFNDMILENGNIDWNLSIHPYPNPLYYPKFWDLSGVANGEMFKAQVDTDQVITFQNLSAVTNVLCQPKYLNRFGTVRDVIIGEIGMGTNAGDTAQAVGLCAAWAAFERNPFITQFMYLEVDVNGFFPTLTPKSREIFNALGTKDEAKYMTWAMKEIGITDWGQVLR